MPLPRWLVRLAIPMIAAAALGTSAATATADPRDDGYLDQLRGAGLTWPDGPRGGAHRYGLPHL